MSVQGPTGQTTIHEKFSEAINGIQGLCEKLKGKTVTTLQKNICKGIISLCKQYNNSIYSIQGHDRRVVARAYQAYKKKSNYIGDATKINNNNFSEKALNATFVTTLQGKDLKAFTMLLTNDSTVSLLNSQNKAIFNNLPMVVQKAFIEQNKNDVEVLSTFSNVYKDELAYDSFSGQPIPELLTAFKDAIVSNRDQIIKDPTILASADKTSILEIASILQTDKGLKDEDKPLMKALLTAYATVDANTVEKQLNELDKVALFSEGNTQQIIDCFNNPEAKIQGELQALKDVRRGFSIDFLSPSGKKISIPGQKGVSQEDLFNEIKKQVASQSLDDEDKKALADFLANSSLQGMFALKRNDEFTIQIEGNGSPHLEVKYTNDGIVITLNTQGKSQTEKALRDQNNNILGLFFPTTTAEIVFTYDKGSLLECSNKASTIEVKKFSQELGEVFVGNEVAAIKGLQKIKNEGKQNSALDIDEFNSLMSNPQILQGNIEYLDKNPAALRKIPKETLQTHIQNALNAKNEPLAKALTKALDYLEQTTFKTKLLEANQKKVSTKSEKNAEPLFRFFQNDDSTMALTDKNFEVLNDAIRQADVKFITKNGTEITVGGCDFTQNPQGALDGIKQQIKEKKLEDAEIKALADFIANGYVQTYVNFIDPSVGFYRWDGDGMVHVTAQMSDKGLDVNVRTQGKLPPEDKNKVIILATANSNIAVLEKTVNADVTFHYKGSIGKAGGCVDTISVEKFEQQIGDVTFY